MDSGAAGAKAVGTSLGGGANAIDIVTREDLGGGMNGGFTSQIRFNAATGDMNSTAGGGTALFHAANVYVGNKLGTARVGKIAEANNCAFDPWACTGGAGLAGGVGVSSLAGAGTQAQSVSFALNPINGFSASYQTTVSTRTNERTVLNLGYAKGPLTLQAMNIESSGTNAALATGVVGTNTFNATQLVTAIGDDATQRSIGGSYNLGFARISVVNVVSKNNSNTSAAVGTTPVVGTPVLDRDVTALGLTVPMGATTFLAGYSKDSKAVANADTKFAVGVNYALSKRTTIGADLFKAEGQLAAGAPATTNTPAGATAGIPTAFSNVGSGFTIRARHTF